MLAALRKRGRRAGSRSPPSTRPPPSPSPGPRRCCAAWREAAAARRWAFVELDLDYAFHSAAMDPVRDGLLADLAGLAAAPPRVPLISTRHGRGAGRRRAARRLLVAQPARAGALPAGAAPRAPPRTRPTLFLEIGPHPVLAGLHARSLRAAAPARKPPPQCCQLSPRRDGSAAIPSPPSPTAPSRTAPTRAAAPPSPVPRRGAACRPRPSTASASGTRLPSRRGG